MRFKFNRFPNKITVHVGRMIIEAGWYRGMPHCVGLKLLEWFAEEGEVVIVYAQISKAVLCVSWDYGRR